MNHRETEVLQNELRNMREQCYDVPAKSYEEYLKRLGRYEGLKVALELQLELLKGEVDED
jgi:hypothetical protein